jgi:DNA-binding IclR family transcriptional regulator
MLNIDAEKSSLETSLPGASPSSQTLVRGLDVLEQVAEGPAALSAIARELGLSRSTVHRLATTLLERRYLNANPRRGYSLGPKLLELGWLARDQISLVRLARPYLEALAARTGDVALLAIRDHDSVLIADHAAGRRRVLPSLRTGDRLHLDQSALGRALLLPTRGGGADSLADVIVDRGESEPEICTFAAAVRGADGGVRAALGLAAATACVESSELAGAIQAIADAAAEMAGELGWRASRRETGTQEPGTRELGAGVTHGHAALPTAGDAPADQVEKVKGLRETAQGLRHHTAGASAHGTAPRVFATADIIAEGERDRMERPKR